MIRSVIRCAVVLGAVLAVGVGPAALAHEQRNVGDVTLRVGWSTEPAYTDSVNAVLVEVAHQGGGAITDAKLSAVVLFGGRNASTKSATLTLSGSDETPGTYTAPLVPTRPGTFTFHITGTAGSQKIDQFFTSGETTFDDIKDPTADEFPAKDPTPAQLAQRIANADSAAAKAKSDAGRATIALVVAGVALIIGLIALVRR